MILHYDWEQVARLLLTSRALDTMEETELLPRGEVTYQFSAGGHELAQILLALSLDHAYDAAAVYYRSRPFMLTLGLTAEEALAGSMARVGSPSGGRDIGVVFNRVGNGGVTVLPMSGAVGTQFTPVVGWAQAVRYRAQVLGEEDWQGAIGVVLGGDGAVASNGFWSALTIATTLKLPILFLIEDNGYAISVKSDLQTPGRDITKNLASFTNLTLFNADGCDPADAAANIGMAVSLLRTGEGPILLRVRVPRLLGHSSVDNQAYKSAPERLAERARDPLKTLHDWLVPDRMREERWQDLAKEAQTAVEQARDVVRTSAEPDPASAKTHVFFEDVLQQQGGLAPEGRLPSMGHQKIEIESPIRMNLVDAIRKTLEVEMALNSRILLFGEDVGYKGGVHGATRGLQSKFGEQRVFDTSLNEEGIMGRSIGMAIAGLLPLPEIQFRKYLDPATEQTNDIGTIRWRTVNNFAAPMVMRIPGGFGKTVGDPWHSVSDESVMAHKPGWRIAMPSNAQDAVGLLRTALRSNDPTFFFEHRNLLDNIAARRPYPGDNYCLPFGKAAILKEGRYLTVVTWAAMVYRCLEAAKSFADDVEVLDLRTIVPWDKDSVLNSVQKTARCLIVHEDCGTAGFGAEIAATIAGEGFIYLDAPIHRLTGADCPVPYNVTLMNEVLPSVNRIREAMKELLAF
jgi:2-oxoisovalerate dehydrogenase E1 component